MTASSATAAKPDPRPWLKQYPAAVPPELDPTHVGTLADLIRQVCVTYADRDAFESFGKSISFAETGR
jgi:long-chain acyl-CoA synthetase